LKNIVVFTGAGISAESGLKTFRDSNGIWENYNVMDVATPEAWEKDHHLVLEFYNKRRDQILKTHPNEAHKALVELEKGFCVKIITQNIDNLHERAGSSDVLHLHGLITQARSTDGSSKLYDIDGSFLNSGEFCKNGHQLRPNVVWFGEAVPNLTVAEEITAKADVLIIIGSSLNVYPAANLIYRTQPHTETYLIDPKKVDVNLERLHVINEKASIGVTKLVKQLLEKK